MAITILQVTCIVKREHHNPHERIQFIGGIIATGRWRHSELQAIVNIHKGTHEYYVTAKAKTVRVVVAIHNGREYLKTEADGYEPNNLLSLPDCPPM